MAAEAEALRTRRFDASSELFTRWIPRFLGYAGFLGLWSWASGGLVSDRLLPKPWTILREIWNITQSGELWRNFSSTVYKIGLGFALAYLVGVVVGILMARPWLDGFFRDWVVVLLNTPGLVYALVCALIFGFSPVGPIVAVVVCAFPFVTVNVVEGVRAIPKDLMEMGRSFRVGSVRRLRHITLPFLAPYLFTALRYGFSTAWKIVTLTEVFGASRGIGFMFRVEFQLFSITGMLAWIFIFFAFALLLEKVLLQRGINRFFRWRRAGAL